MKSVLRFKLAVILSVSWWESCSSFCPAIKLDAAIRRSGHSNFLSNCAALQAEQRVICETSRIPKRRVDKRDSSDQRRAQAGRRHILSLLSITAASLIPSAAFAAPSIRQRAVGGAELECRANGDCLQKFELDGAIGWQWGAKDRCDASDPLCGADGRIMDAPPTGAATPSAVTGLHITHVASIDLMIGKDGSEQGTLKIGLYGDAFPEDVERFLSFLDAQGGIITSDDPGFGMVSTPVALARGGQLALVYPRQKIEFGIPSQRSAYVRRIGRPKAGDLFTPQPLPPKTPPKSRTVSRQHDCAGLISIPAGGVGNGGGNLVPDDEAFANSFQVTATAIPAMDKDGRKVVGQLLDRQSMAVLERLASLPPNKGLKGVLPGQSNGPPLLKVTVKETDALEIKQEQAL